MLAAIIILLVIIADQVTKYIVVQNLELKESAPFIDGFMKFRRAHNTGGGWSILDGGGFERFVLIGVSVGAMVLVAIVLIKNYRRHPLMNISLAMILGGGIGNMIDRIRLQYVVDFLYTEFIDFPTFNIADCFITVGAILLGVYVIFYDSKVEKRLRAEKEANEKLIEIKPEEVSSQAEETEKGEIDTEEKGEND